MTMLRKPILIAAATLLLAGCDANWGLQKAVDAAREAEARAKERCTEARNSRDDYLAARAAARQEVRTLEAEIQFEAIAAQGDAGTSEALRLMKRKIDDPYYEEGRGRLLEAAKSRLEYLSAEPKRHHEEVRLACDEHLRARADLKKKRAALDRARRG